MLAVSLALVVAGTLLAVLLGSGGSGSNAAPAAEQTTDGYVVRITRAEVVLAPLSAPGTEESFEILPQHAAALDLQHLQLHIEDRTPVRMFWRQEGDRRVALRQIDAPASP